MFNVLAIVTTSVTIKIKPIVKPLYFFYNHIKFRNQAQLYLAMQDFEVRIMLSLYLNLHSTRLLVQYKKHTVLLLHQKSIVSIARDFLKGYLNAPTLGTLCRPLIFSNF